MSFFIPLLIKDMHLFFDRFVDVSIYAVVYPLTFTLVLFKQVRTHFFVTIVM